MKYPTVKFKDAIEGEYYWAMADYGWRVVVACECEDDLFFFESGSECEVKPKNLRELRGPIPKPEDESWQR